MSISKPWDWEAGKEEYWLLPGEMDYYLATRWKELGFKDLLDFGCGLGRHSIFFAESGFNVSAFDLSEYGVNYTKEWAEKEKLNIKVDLMDMLHLSYADECFDCLMAYHVISHTDSNGIKTIINEISRVLKPGGEIYLSLCSKDTPRFKDKKYPLLDANTVIVTDDGPEKDVPHFYVDADDVKELFKDFEFIHVRHVDDTFFKGQFTMSLHYFIHAKKK